MKSSPARIGRLARVVALAGVVVAFAPPLAPLSVALGQENQQVGRGARGGQPRGTGRSLLNRQNGGFRSGLSGVKSAAPRPIKSLGGVKAQLPRPIANRGSLLPPPPAADHRSNDRVNRRPTRDVPGLRAPGDFFRDPRRGSGRGNEDGFRGRFDSETGFRGSFNDDDFRLRFNIGGGRASFNDVREWSRHRRRDHHRDHDRHDHRNTIVWPWWYGYGYGWYDRYDYYPPETMVSSPVYVDPTLLGMQQQATQPQTASEPPTDVELADWAMYEGRVDDAIDGYREHLEENAEDADAMRRLAIALVMDKKVKEGVAMLAMAYEKDLSLVRQPMSADLLPDGERDLHGALLAVVPFANRMKSASGYLAVTVLMQAQGRDAVALKILEKAKGAGLDEKLAAELEMELGG